MSDRLTSHHFFDIQNKNGNVIERQATLIS
jgi:hypothetical protein